MTIRGERKSYEQLLAASGYSDRRDAFETVLNILDKEVRLITPAEPDVSFPDHGPAELRTEILSADARLPGQTDSRLDYAEAARDAARPRHTSPC